MHCLHSYQLAGRQPGSVAAAASCRQQQQQQQQHRQHLHHTSQHPSYTSRTAGSTIGCLHASSNTAVSACWGHPRPHIAPHAHRLCIVAAAASAGSEQPPAPRKQQLFDSKAQKSQQESSSMAEPVEEGEEEEEEGEYDEEQLDMDEGEGDEYEGLEDWEEEGDEGEWDEDEDWEDEEAEDDVSPAPAALQIPQDQKAVAFTQDDFVEVGLISRPHGVRGEVKVQLITDEPKKRLGTAGKRLWLQALPLRSGLVQPSTAAARKAGGSDPFKTLQRVVVQSGRVARPGAKGQREEWAVKFEGINNREQAATLAGFKLLLALCDREARPRGRDEFFIDQLVGLKAVDDASDILIGIVTEIYEAGASYSLLRVRLAPEEADIAASKYRSVLVPFVTEMVPTVDVAGGQLRMTLPEGLLETASSTKLRKAYTPEQQEQLRQQLKQWLEQQQAWQQQQQQQQQQDSQAQQ